MDFVAKMFGMVRAAWLLRFRRGHAARRAIFDPSCNEFLLLFAFLRFSDARHYPWISLGLARRILQRLPELVMPNDASISSQAQYVQICALYHLLRYEEAVSKAQELRNDAASFDALDAGRRDYIDKLAANSGGDVG